jgi:hypothetical protein
MPLGMQMTLAASAAMPKFVGLAEQRLVLGQFSSSFDFALPQWQPSTGMAERDYYHTVVAPIFAARIRPRFNAALTQIAMSQTPYQGFKGAGFDNVSVPELAASGIATYAATDVMLAAVADDVHRQYSQVIGPKPLPPWGYRGKDIALRASIYVALGAILYAVNIGSWQKALAFLAGLTIAELFSLHFHNRARDGIEQELGARRIEAAPLVESITNVGAQRRRLVELKPNIERATGPLPFTQPEFRAEHIRAGGVARDVIIFRDETSLAKGGLAYNHFLAVMLPPDGQIEIRIAYLPGGDPRALMLGGSGEQFVTGGLLKYSAKGRELVVLPIVGDDAAIAKIEYARNVFRRSLPSDIRVV